MDPFSIESKLDLPFYQKAWIKVSFNLISRKILLGLLALISLIGIVLSIIGPEPKFVLIFYPLFMFALILFLPWFKSRRYFKNNPRMQETWTVDFSETGIEVTGESFSTSYKWENAKKFLEWDNLIVIYPSAIEMLVFDPAAFNEQQLKSLREKVKGLPGLKTKFAS